MAITPEVRMEAEAGERTLEVVWVGAGGAARTWINAGCLAAVGILIILIKCLGCIWAKLYLIIFIYSMIR